MIALVPELASSLNTLEPARGQAEIADEWDLAYEEPEVGGGLHEGDGGLGLDQSMNDEEHDSDNPKSQEAEEQEEQEEQQDEEGEQGDGWAPSDGGGERIEAETEEVDAVMPWDRGLEGEESEAAGGDDPDSEQFQEQREGEVQQVEEEGGVQQVGEEDDGEAPPVPASPNPKEVVEPASPQTLRKKDASLVSGLLPAVSSPRLKRSLSNYLAQAEKSDLHGKPIKKQLVLDVYQHDIQQEPVASGKLGAKPKTKAKPKSASVKVSTK